MKKFILVTFAFGVFVGCGKDSSSSKNAKGEREEEVVYACTNDITIPKISKCEKDHEMVERLLFEMKQWPPPDGGRWYSKMFETRRFKRLYTSDEQKIKCFIRTFCKEKVL